MDRAMSLPDFPPDFHVDLPPIPVSFFDQHGGDIDRHQQHQLLLMADPPMASSCSGELDLWLPEFCCSDSNSPPFLDIDSEPQRSISPPLSPRPSGSLSLSDESSSSQNNFVVETDHRHRCLDLALAQQQESMLRNQQLQLQQQREREQLEEQQREQQQQQQQQAAARPRSSKSGPTERMMDITLDELSHYFHMPITQASKELKVGLTVLKKRCREFGIPRWPHRKLKSLESLIHNIQELSKDCQGRKNFMDAVRELENQKRSMEESPGIELSERTKRLRQACFKQSYKQRRQALAKLEEEDDDD